ncbi:MAG: hypothetical protein JSW08_00415 [archaeon]|nr:MAG: hypothetical protein JSW08_00415 [archaeon]
MVENSQEKKESLLKHGKKCLKNDEELLEEARKVLNMNDGDFQDLLKIAYNNIIELLKTYLDMPKPHYKVIALWVIGTYFHKQFSTYPYLFFNAMKGSGKSRALKLISKIVKNGNLIISITESVLFRTAHLRTLCIDEFEQVGSKEKQALRELLNSAYKKGGIVERAYKKKSMDRESIEIETFDVYTPVTMANIRGMDNVLADRCITLMLEKSSNKSITRLIENFEDNKTIEKVRAILETCASYYSKSVLKGELSVVNFSKITYKWNTYIHSFNKYISTLTTHTTLNTPSTPSSHISGREKDLFNKILRTELEGRNLELFFPLFLLADMCGVFDEILEIGESIIKERRDEDYAESRDIALLDHLAHRYEIESDFIAIKKISNDLLSQGEEYTPHWIGHAIKRLGVLIERRRMREGVEVRINFTKAKEKIRMFRPDQIIQEEKVEEW